MTNKDIVINAHFNMGRENARILREKAVAGDITDTEIIDNEQDIPEWSDKRNYIGMAVDTPFTWKGQVYGLIQGHDASHYENVEPGTQGGAPFWRIKHTTNPYKAKPWVQPDATNPYKRGECMVWKDGTTKRATRDTTFSPEEYAPDWEDVIL